MRYAFIMSAIGAGLLLGGCGTSALNVFTANRVYQDALPYTKKGEIRNNTELLAIMTATYLNATGDAADGNREEFLVGLYLTNDLPKSRGGLNNPSYHLTPNGADANSSVEVTHESEPLLHSLPLVNRWSRYYRVTFPRQESKMALELCNLESNLTTVLSLGIGHQLHT